MTDSNCSNMHVDSAAGFPSALDVPVSTGVYQQVLQRMRNLNAVRDYIRQATTLNEDPLPISSLDYAENLVTHIQSLSVVIVADNFHYTNDTNSIANVNSLHGTGRLRAEIVKAKAWLLEMITLQEQNLQRCHFHWIFRSAIESEEWTDFQSLYMVLSDPEFPDPNERLNVALGLTVHLNLAIKHADTLERAKQHASRTLKIRILQAPNSFDEVKFRLQIVEKYKNSTIDAFACAVPLKTIKDLKDEHDRQCPICHNHYFDFARASVIGLLSNYPVRIMFCGHIVGKACLEHWVKLPPINPAKYPFHTCPLCRVQITNMEQNGLNFQPESFGDRFTDSAQRVKWFREVMGLGYTQCKNGVKQLLNEEIAVKELMSEVENMDDAKDEKKVVVMQVLKEKLRDVRAEKRVWGFEETAWNSMKKEWLDSGVKR